MPAQPPRPVGPGSPPPKKFEPPKGKPISTAAGGGGGTARSSATQVSVDTVVDPSLPQLMPKRERILLAGDSNSGKTYIWLRMAYNDFHTESNWAGLDTDNPKYVGPKYLVLDTDNTAPDYLHEGDEFEELYFGNGGNVFPWPAFDFQQTRKAMAGILKVEKAGDWIVIDVSNRIYDQTRDFVAQLRKIDRSDEAIVRALNTQGFGEGDVGFWNLAQITHDSLTNRILLSDDIHAHVLMLAHTTDIVEGREKREVTVMFDDIGIKPRGRPQIPGQMTTVCVVWSRKVIVRDQSRKRTREYFERFIDVVKDRGKPMGQRFPYDKDFYVKLDEIRHSGSKLATLDMTQLAEGDTVETVSEHPNTVDAPSLNGIPTVTKPTTATPIESIPGSASGA